MADDRYNRWQGLAATQLSVAIALISGLSVSALELAFSLLQGGDFLPCGMFKLSCLAFLVGICLLFTSIIATYANRL
jgi:hypothetical protein